jgi:hypothetical protein
MEASEARTMTTEIAQEIDGSSPNVSLAATVAGADVRGFCDRQP